MANPTFSETAAAPVPQTPSTCAHHWVLETPAGELSRGRCRNCGAIKEFRNSTTDVVWEEERRSAVNFWAGGTSSYSG